MPPIDKPPMSPQAQAQMGPPGGPGFGPGVGQAQEQVGKGEARSRRPFDFRKQARPQFT